ncbi:MAG: hypothetical protein D6746_14810 [Bacteroidetes bacterium]|nr:MAG: hypothetical protein D6746_14810 [Bacteroidota bacterium]
MTKISDYRHHYLAAGTGRQRMHLARAGDEHVRGHKRMTLCGRWVHQAHVHSPDEVADLQVCESCRRIADNELLERLIELAHQYAEQLRQRGVAEVEVNDFNADLVIKSKYLEAFGRVIDADDR